MVVKKLGASIITPTTASPPSLPLHPPQSPSVTPSVPCIDDNVNGCGFF